MNTTEWLAGIVKEYGQEAADKCAGIIEEALRRKQEVARENAIAEIANIGGYGRLGVECAARLYDAGYRKFEIVEEDV